jgi:hypothetical protein
MLFFSHADPGVARLILSDIATSTMTVVSIVFAILLMTPTLASLPAARLLPTPFSSVVTVIGAIVLAIARVGLLLFLYPSHFACHQRQSHS